MESGILKNTLSTVRNFCGAIAIFSAFAVTLPAVASETISTLTAGRFLEQAAFGPTPNAMMHLKGIGIDAWLDEQFKMPETEIPLPPTGDRQYANIHAQYLTRLSTAPDQLRQRVAYALSQVIVISMEKNGQGYQIIPYLRILSRNAFGNYRTLLDEITLSSQMGYYLDLAGSSKVGTEGANENYARELMQLFTIGLVKLKMDGTPELTPQRKTIPVYDQVTVGQVSLALTGWTYANGLVRTPQSFNAPMIPVDSRHDISRKEFLGCTLFKEQGTVLDKEQTLDCVFNHPNVPPFISLRLIRSLVTSNPSSEYVERIAKVFANNGSGVRGDLKSVVRAILTDTEARKDTANIQSGRLKDPIFQTLAFARALSGYVTNDNDLDWQLAQMGQNPLTPPSVFNFYSPLFRLPAEKLAAPEFQIYTPTEAARRGNLLWRMIASTDRSFVVDIAPFKSVASDPQKLIDTVDQALLYGRMSAGMRTQIARAIDAQVSEDDRWQTALYLVALSGPYAVAH